MLGVRPRGRTVPLAVKVGAILRPPGGLGLGRTRPGRASRDPPICRRNPRRRSFPAISPASSCTTSGLRGTRRRASRAATVVPVGRSRASARAQRGKNCGNGAGDAPYPATGFDSSSRSTTSRIRGDLDVRVPRRSARARASVRRWPWSSRRGRSVQVKLIKMGGRLVRHSRRLIFQLSEVSVPRWLFHGVLDRIGRLSPEPS